MKTESRLCGLPAKYMEKETGHSFRGVGGRGVELFCFGCAAGSGIVAGITLRGLPWTNAKVRDYNCKNGGRIDR